MADDARINRLASDVHDKSGGEIAVAVLRDLPAPATLLQKRFHLVGAAHG